MLLLFELGASFNSKSWIVKLISALWLLLYVFVLQLVPSRSGFYSGHWSTTRQMGCRQGNPASNCCKFWCAHFCNFVCVAMCFHHIYKSLPILIREQRIDEYDTSLGGLEHTQLNLIPSALKPVMCGNNDKDSNNIPFTLSQTHCFNNFTKLKPYYTPRFTELFCNFLCILFILLNKCRETWYLFFLWAKTWTHWHV